MKARIGEVAGQVWHSLEKNGPTPLTAVPRRLKGVPQNEILMALGGLAREDQIDFVNQGAETRVTVRKQA